MLMNCAVKFSNVQLFGGKNGEPSSLVASTGPVYGTKPLMFTWPSMEMLRKVQSNRPPMSVYGLDRLVALSPSTVNPHTSGSPVGVYPSEARRPELVPLMSNTCPILSSTTSEIVIEWRY